MTYYCNPHKAFTLWTGPCTRAGKSLFPGKPPFPSTLPKRSRDGSRFRAAVVDILSGIEIYEPEKGYRHAWQRVFNLREHFNLPSCYHSWAGGYLDCVIAKWYREKVIFLYIMPDGTRVEYSKATQAQKDIIHPRETTNENYGHFWIKSGRSFN
jgi:hypothetical protein